MRTLLGWLEAAATRRPAAVIAALAAATVGMATLASGLEVEVDLSQLGSQDSEAVQAMDRVRDDFGDPAAAVQVILDAGAGGDMITAGGLEAIAAAEGLAVEALGSDIRTGDDGRPQLLSLASATGATMAQQGLDPGGLDDEQVGAIVDRLIAASPRLAGLLSDDLDLDEGTARATVLVAMLDPGLTEPERTDAGERVQAAFDGDHEGALQDVRVTVFSSGLLVSGLLEAIRAEVPRLFGLALLVVLAILALLYRSLFDVAIGFAGLLATVVWTLGLAALLGPAHLGWTGPLTQFVVVIPVLLVGLGIDYSVHLTARYREQRAAGQTSSAAAGRALHTVGAALVLATAATAIGFGSIATAPLQMLADFGLFVAVGVVSAFVIMGLLVPAARVWRDRRRTGADPGAVRELGLAGLMRGPVWLARRSPWAGMAVAAVLVGASLLAATGLEVEFNRDDFIPEGSRIEAVLAHQRALFGGGVTESTFVVVDGDLTDPAVASAVSDAQISVGGIEGVRAVGGVPQVRSVVAADARAGLVQIRTTAGDAGAERIQREVQAAFAPVQRAGASVTVTSEPIIIAEMSEELSAFQARAIGLTLAVVLALITAYYAVANRRPLLGVIVMIPAVVGASLILGTMWLLGISFNVLTATLTAIAVGIGVPYGVHVVNRFTEDIEDAPAADAIARTLHGTGAALTGSALTTLGAFVVLAFSGLPPMRSLGLLGGAGIAFALLAAVLVEPGALMLWARRCDRRPDGASAGPLSASEAVSIRTGTSEGQ